MKVEQEITEGSRMQKGISAQNTLLLTEPNRFPACCVSKNIQWVPARGLTLQLESTYAPSSHNPYMEASQCGWNMCDSWAIERDPQISLS